MALEITGNIELQGGISVGSLYGRTEFNLLNSGNKVWVVMNYYLTEEGYTQGTTPVYPEFFVKSEYDYDRLTDGVDLLDFSNQVIKTELEAQGFSVVITEL